MVLRIALIATALAGLSACASQVPDSGPVGFDNYDQQRAARDAALARPTYLADTVVPPGQTGPVPNSVVTGAPLTAPTATPAPGSAEAVAADTRQVLQSTSAPVYSGQVISSNVNPQQAGALTAGGAALDNPGISDENSFDAVSSRQTIQSDAARLQQTRSQYQVIEPVDLPTRSGSADPNIVTYALQTQHPRGQQLYQRSNFSGQGRFERNCASYASNDLAQIDFLARGGPVNDRRGLDPDGDGYACGWDPTPFRNVAGG